MKKLLFFVGLAICSQSHAGLPDMIKIYNNPAAAPAAAICKGDAKCNAFVALAKQWQSIPNNYRYHNSRDLNIKEQAAQGDGYGLNKGYGFCTDKARQIEDAGESVFWGGGSKGKRAERVFGQGLAVLLFIEDKSGWANC